jgi:hypothetical protein
MPVSDQAVAVLATPLNLTTLAPCAFPKLDPVMVTEAPGAAAAGEIEVMLGAGVTVKVMLLLVTPPAVTTTEPVVAPTGTGTKMLLSFQLLGVAGTPLNCTVLAP